MTFWTLFQDAAWVLAAIVACWMLFDAYRIGRDYDEEFLTHTVEDLGDDAAWQQDASGQQGDVEKPHQ